MNLLSLILIFLGLSVGVAICFIAWELSSGFWDPVRKPPERHSEEKAAGADRKEPGESRDRPGS